MRANARMRTAINPASLAEVSPTCSAVQRQRRSMEAFRIDSARLWQSLMDMAKIGATPRGGVCRVALTDIDLQGRDLFVRWAREAGCAVEIDQMGNIFARRPGTDNTLPPVLTGS